MSEWYHARAWGDPEITPVEVTRHTDSFVWIEGRRRLRIAQDEAFFPVALFAVGWIRSRLRRDFEKAQLNLASQREKREQFDRYVRTEFPETLPLSG